MVIHILDNIGYNVSPQSLSAVIIIACLQIFVNIYLILKIIICIILRLHKSLIKI